MGDQGQAEECTEEEAIAVEGAEVEGWDVTEPAMEVDLPAAVWSQMLGSPDAFRPRCSGVAEFATTEGGFENNFLKGVGPLCFTFPMPVFAYWC